MTKTFYPKDYKYTSMAVNMVFGLVPRGYDVVTQFYRFTDFKSTWVRVIMPKGVLPSKWKLIGI